MSVPTITETRTYGRILSTTKDAILPGIQNVAYDVSPLMSAFVGRLNDAQFGPVRMMGRGRATQEGGASVEIYHRLGRNATAQTLLGPWAMADTTPQDNIRFSRSNWALYDSTATVAEAETLYQRGDAAIARIVTEESTDAVTSVVDLVGDHCYDNGGDATRVTSLNQLANANDTLQGLSGATFPRWNSRGLSPRGTAPAAVTFAATAGGFAATGINDMRTSWLNASENNRQPHGGYTSYQVFGFYEAAIVPQERFTNTTLADAGFQQLAFKTTPVFPDSKSPAGSFYWVNFDAVQLTILAGAEFQLGDFIEGQQQHAMTAKCLFIGQLTCKDRRFVNRFAGITP